MLKCWVFVSMRHVNDVWFLESIFQADGFNGLVLCTDAIFTVFIDCPERDTTAFCNQANQLLADILRLVVLTEQPDVVVDCDLCWLTV